MNRADFLKRVGLGALVTAVAPAAVAAAPSTAGMPWYGFDKDGAIKELERQRDGLREKKNIIEEHLGTLDTGPEHGHEHVEMWALEKDTNGRYHYNITYEQACCKVCWRRTERAAKEDGVDITVGGCSSYCYELDPRTKRAAKETGVKVAVSECSHYRKRHPLNRGNPTDPLHL